MMSTLMIEIDKACPRCGGVIVDSTLTVDTRSIFDTIEIAVFVPCRFN